MSVERQYGLIIFLCDVGKSSRCEEQIETDLSDFREAYQFAQTKGWNAVPLTGGTSFMHYCGRCPRPR